MLFNDSVFIKIFPEFGKNYSFLSHEGKEKLFCCLEEGENQRTEFFFFF